MLRPAVAVINCVSTAEASGGGIGKRAPVSERKLDPAMPGVTGSPTCPASGNPSTTAGKLRYRRRRPVPPCAAVRGGILAAIGWNPSANRRLLPLYQKLRRAL